MFDVGRGFIAAVERAPDALAVVDGERRQTYAEWLESIRRAVGGLDAMGWRAGDHLLVALQNNWEMATLHWACQLAGVIVTPVNWRLTADEMNFFVENADAKGLVFQDVSAEAAAGSPLAQDLPRIAVAGAAGRHRRLRGPLGGGARRRTAAGRGRGLLGHALYLGHHGPAQGRAAPPPGGARLRRRPHRPALVHLRRTHAWRHAALPRHGGTLVAGHGGGQWVLRVPAAL